MAYIDNAAKHKITQDDDDTASVNTVESEGSDETVNHTNSNNQFAPLANQKTKKRSVNNGLDGYKKPPAKPILYCKAKISVPQNESPTQKLHSSLAMILTTLLKIDTSAKIFKYKDKTSMLSINYPDQIHEIPSKIKEFFHGRYRPFAKAMTIWSDIKVGFNIPEDIFLEIALPYSVKR